MWQFNNYVTLKLPFDPPTPPPITHRQVCSRKSSCVTSRSAQKPAPFPIRKVIFSYKY